MKSLRLPRPARSVAPVPTCGSRAGIRRTKLDKTSCVRTLTEKGVWKIAKGTGAYATAKGHGHYKATGTIQGTHTDSGCDFTTPTGTIAVTATGKVRL